MSGRRVSEARERPQFSPSELAEIEASLARGERAIWLHSIARPCARHIHLAIVGNRVDRFVTGHSDAGRAALKETTHG